MTSCIYFSYLSRVCAGSMDSSQDSLSAASCSDEMQPWRLRMLHCGRGTLVQALPFSTRQLGNWGSEGGATRGMSIRSADGAGQCRRPYGDPHAWIGEHCGGAFADIGIRLTIENCNTPPQTQDRWKARWREPGSAGSRAYSVSATGRRSTYNNPCFTVRPNAGIGRSIRRAHIG